MARHVEEPAGIPTWLHWIGWAWIALLLLAAGSLLWGVRGAYAPTGHTPTAVANVPAPTLELEPTPSASPSPTPTPKPAFYKTCKAAKKAGALPLRQGQPGYRQALDSDRDGKACENYG